MNACLREAKFSSKKFVEEKGRAIDCSSKLAKIYVKLFHSKYFRNSFAENYRLKTIFKLKVNFYEINDELDVHK